jgi:hypothetical protein
MGLRRAESCGIFSVALVQTENRSIGNCGPLVRLYPPPRTGERVLGSIPRSENRGTTFSGGKFSGARSKQARAEGPMFASMDPRLPHHFPPPHRPRPRLSGANPSGDPHQPPFSTSPGRALGRPLSNPRRLKERREQA